MSQKKHKPHWQRKQESYANVDVGISIECANCSRKLFRSRYSNNQIQKFQEKVYHARRGGEAAELPRCRDCTADNRVELKCTGCMFTKGIDCFAKAQRKDPDNAKCFPCQQEIQDRLPDLKESVEEEQIREDYRAGRLGPFPGMSSVGSALPSIDGSITDSRNKSHVQSVTSDGRVRIVQDGESAWGDNRSTARSTSPTMSTVSGYKAHPVSDLSAPRVASAYSTGTNRRGFHKTAAYKASTQERVFSQIQREDVHKNQTQVSNRDISDDEEEWEL
ncbi:hypothetical protein, variant [Exophiala xenobiotica]|uniref:Stc1 domain-containing protein n=1 Tax=Exophiala xenobiotica TaxID=348802 RepID=A0A0D2ES66_9EURO|nr:hypothetical protein, variant [Exophiala xenobiotica]KIW58543.1 hypothetical protein, variant [Exophiala xenobiotica]